jgi:phosphomethylpyrimidine synthase
MPPGVRVPMRAIDQTPTRPTRKRVSGITKDEPNPLVVVYDTSGPYTDPEGHIDPAKGLAPLRASWIGDRKDTAELEAPSSGDGKDRSANESLDA